MLEVFKEKLIKLEQIFWKGIRMKKNQCVPKELKKQIILKWSVMFLNILIVNKYIDRE